MINLGLLGLLLLYGGVDRGSAYGAREMVEISGIFHTSPSLSACPRCLHLRHVTKLRLRQGLLSRTKSIVAAGRCTPGDVAVADS